LTSNRYVVVGEHPDHAGCSSEERLADAARFARAERHAVEQREDQLIDDLGRIPCIGPEAVMLRLVVPHVSVDVLRMNAADGNGAWRRLRRLSLTRSGRARLANAQRRRPGAVPPLHPESPRDAKQSASELIATFDVSARAIGDDRVSHDAALDQSPIAGTMIHDVW